jgi:hypothetical protein
VSSLLRNESGAATSTQCVTIAHTRKRWLTWGDIRSGATLETTSCETNKDLYAKWCARWVTTSRKQDDDPGRFLTGAQLYDLRCAFLHNGSEGLNKPPAVPSQVLQRYVVRRREASPGGGKIRIRDWTAGTLQTSAASICEDVARGVRAWTQNAADNDIVKRNLPTLLNLDAAGWQ